VESPQKIQFPKITDQRGNLTFIQFSQQIPFEIKRTFWTYNVPGGETRGGHAYKTQEEVIVALSGSFDVVITNTEGNIDRIHLNRGYEGLYVPPNTWRHLENFSTNSVSLHLSNSVFNTDDYMRDFDLYKELK
jgi:hypothetical protein